MGILVICVAVVEYIMMQLNWSDVKTDLGSKEKLHIQNKIVKMSRKSYTKIV